jgi:dihydrofolate reductase
MDTGLNISIIAAVAEKNVIGQEGKIPWVLQSDLQYFAKLTKGHKVIVGRKTYESMFEQLGYFLTGRQVIVLTRRTELFPLNKDEIANSWEEALKKARGEKEVFVIGGAEIYALAVPQAKKMYITRVHTRCEGDTFFPQSLFNIEEWQKVSSEAHIRDKKNEYDYTFVVFVKRKQTTNLEKRTESFVNLDNARLDEQRDIMKMIQEEGFCPFCPENISRTQLKPIIKEGKYWHLRENRWPYQNTRVHLLAIHNKHIEKLSEISPEAAKELFELAKWIESKYQIEGGGIGIRFGDIRQNGGTVLHLHAHIMSADITDRNKPKYQPVRFRIG